jgi:hypothetical protein
MSSPAWAPAEAACEPIQRRAHASAEAPSPEDEARRADEELALARCLREHGLDVPDPQLDGDGRSSVAVGATLDHSDPDVRQAVRECTEATP